MTLDELDGKIRQWLACQRSTQSYDAQLALTGDDRGWQVDHLKQAHFENAASQQVVSAMQAMHIPAGCWYQCGDTEFKVDRDGNIWTRHAST